MTHITSRVSCNGQNVTVLSGFMQKAASTEKDLPSRRLDLDYHDRHRNAVCVYRKELDGRARPVGPDSWLNRG